MCSGSKRKPTQAGFIMEVKSHKQDGVSLNFSVLLKLSAANDLISFKSAIEEEDLDVDQPSLWFGRTIGSKTMGFEERTPLMIAAILGIRDVLNYIIDNSHVDVNRVEAAIGPRRFVVLLLVARLVLPSLPRFCLMFLLILIVLMLIETDLVFGVFCNQMLIKRKWFLLEKIKEGNQVFLLSNESYVWPAHMHQYSIDRKLHQKGLLDITL